MSRATERVSLLEGLSVAVAERRQHDLRAMERVEMGDRNHPDARVAWADAPYPAPLVDKYLARVGEMGAPYAIKHPVWPPKVTEITAETERKARDLDRVLDLYAKPRSEP